MPWVLNENAEALSNKAGEQHPSSGEAQIELH